MRSIYTLFFYVVTPLILLRLYWRGIKAPEYRKRWLERFAVYQQSFKENVIWIHAVSVGEAEACFPLIKGLQQNYPESSFLVTTTTPTGSARVKAVLADAVYHVYLPYDLPPVVTRFLTLFKPQIAIFLEKEIWPNLYAQCAEKSIPIAIINARLSENSAKGYKKMCSLFVPALQKVSLIAAQTEEDRLRFIEIGARERDTHTVGNLKFDLERNDQLISQARQIKKKLFPERFVWLIASTHEGEEAIFVELYPQLKKQIPSLLMVLVPRHPERFESVKMLVESKSLNVRLRSSGQPCDEETDSYIIDSMGELKLFYGAADLCFVGGSMVAVGGHNILEPAAMKVPIMFGPQMFNFKDIARSMLELGAVIQCSDKDEIMRYVYQLYQNSDDRQQLVEKAGQFLDNNRGATERVIKQLAVFLT